MKAPFNERLRAVRLAHEISQTTAATRVGCSAGTFSKWESGGQPARSLIPNIAAFLGEPESDLLAELAPKADIPEAKDIGSRLLNARKTLGLTREAAAMSIGVGTETLGHWERGQFRPSAASMVKVEAFYGMSPGHLLTFLTPKEK